MDLSDGTSEWLSRHPGADLTPLEERMLAAAVTGELVDLGEGPYALAEMQAWQDDRTVRALVLRHLLLASEWPADARGVRLRGVRISGHLDLEAADIRCPLMLDWCYLDAAQPACLDHATVLRVSLTNCRLAGLTAVMLTAKGLDLSRSIFAGTVRLPGADIAGQVNCSGAQLAAASEGGGALDAEGLKARSVILSDGFTASGAVWLHRAEIAELLDCRGAHLTGRDNDGNALIADGLKASSVVLNGAFAEVGAVRLHHAEITVALNCRGARLAGHDDEGDALVADRLKAADVYLTDGFTAVGAVRLPGADIAGQVVCSDARLTGSNNGDALVAVELKAGSVILTDVFIAAGAVLLSRAEITGLLLCRSARLTGHNQDGALIADGMTVGGDVILDRGLTLGGGLSLRSTQVGGSIYVMPDKLAEGKNEMAFDARSAQISGTLEWAPAAPASGQVNLEGAAAGQLEDYWSPDRANGYWPTGGLLSLDGFTYGRISGAHQATVAQRLEWIRGQYQSATERGESKAFAAQPYEQLASVYRQAGQETQARKVAIARRADLRRYGNLTLYRKAANWLLDKTIKYGYQTWRAAAGLAVLYLAVTGLSWLAQRYNLIVPVGDITGLHPVPSAAHCTPDYPCFYPAGYAIDTVIPIISVHQASYWGIDGSAAWGWAWVAGTWIATGLGWALATLLVAGYTGLVRQQ